MITSNKTLKRLAIFLISATLPLFAACGGGDGEGGKKKEDTVTGPNLLACGITVIVGGDTDTHCSSSSSSSGSGGSNSSGGSGATASSGNSTLLNPNTEMEPNDDLMNANVPYFAGTAATTKQVGWQVSGQVNDMQDVQDAYALTPRRSYRYRIALCPPKGTSCENQFGLDTITAFWRVLDQDGNVLLTSEADRTNKKYIELDAGVMYYVTVNAGDTMGASVGYELFVFERQ